MTGRGFESLADMPEGVVEVARQDALDPHIVSGLWRNLVRTNARIAERLMIEIQESGDAGLSPEEASLRATTMLLDIMSLSSDGQYESEEDFLEALSASPERPPTTT